MVVQHFLFGKAAAANFIFTHASDAALSSSTPDFRDIGCVAPIMVPRLLAFVGSSVGSVRISACKMQFLAFTAYFCFPPVSYYLSLRFFPACGGALTRPPSRLFITQTKITLSFYLPIGVFRRRWFRRRAQFFFAFSRFADRVGRDRIDSKKTDYLFLIFLVVQCSRKGPCTPTTTGSRRLSAFFLQ